MHFRSTCLLLAASVVLSACQSKEPAAPAGATQAAQPPLFKPISEGADTGAPASMRYEGTLPCADCAGIKTELTLNLQSLGGAPTSYDLRETYLGAKGGDRSVTSTGVWGILQGTARDKDLTIYQLNPGRPEDIRSFEKISNDEIRLLDRQQNRIESKAQYSLKLVGPFGAPAAPTTATMPVGVAAMVTDLATGWPVQLQVGQELSVRLTADKGSGMSWTPNAGLDAGVLVLQGAPTYENVSVTGKVGAGGTEVYRVKAMKPGQATLAFAFGKKGAAPAKTASYQVTVK